MPQAISKSKHSKVHCEHWKKRERESFEKYSDFCNQWKQYENVMCLTEYFRTLNLIHNSQSNEFMHEHFEKKAKIIRKNKYEKCASGFWARDVRIKRHITWANNHDRYTIHTIYMITIEGYRLIISSDDYRIPEMGNESALNFERNFTVIPYSFSGRKNRWKWTHDEKWGKQYSVQSFKMFDCCSPICVVWQVTALLFLLISRAVKKIVSHKAVTG